MSPTPPRARASWYATSRSDTRPCSAMTVSCPDDTMRLRRVAEPIRSGVNSSGNAAPPPSAVIAMPEGWRARRRAGDRIAHDATPAAPRRQRAPRNIGTFWPLPTPYMSNRGQVGRGGCAGGPTRRHRDAGRGARPRGHAPLRPRRRPADRGGLRGPRIPAAHAPGARLPDHRGRRRHRPGGVRPAARGAARRPGPRLDGGLVVDRVPQPRPVARPAPAGRPSPAARQHRSADRRRPPTASSSDTRMPARSVPRWGRCAPTRAGSSSSPRPVVADRGWRRGSADPRSRRGPCCAAAGVSCARRSPSPPEPHRRRARPARGAAVGRRGPEPLVHLEPAPVGHRDPPVGRGRAPPRAAATPARRGSPGSAVGRPNTRT